MDQLEGVDPQQTAIQVVVQADTAAQRAQRESEALEASGVWKQGGCWCGGGDAQASVAGRMCVQLHRGVLLCLG